MSFVAHPTLDDLMSYGYEHRSIVAMAEAAKEYDERTGQNQLERDTENYTRDVLRADKLRDYLASTANPHDRTLIADEIERLDRIIAMEAERLGL